MFTAGARQAAGRIGISLGFMAFNISIGAVVYHYANYLFFTLFFIPIIIFGICALKFKSRKIPLFCMAESLIIVTVLCGIGVIFASMNEVAVMVIMVLHFFVNVLPYLLCFTAVWIEKRLRAHTKDDPAH